MTHVLISLVAHGDGTYSLEQDGPKTWKFWSLWMVGKDFFAGERCWTEVFVSVLTAARSERGSYTFIVDIDTPRWSVWPGVFQKPKPVTPTHTTHITSLAHIMAR